METPSASAAPYDLGRVRYVTERFGGMQGLRLVPFGLYLLVLAAGTAGLVPRVRPGALDVSLGLLLMAVAGSWLIGRYYDSRFGRVAPMASGRGSAGAGTGALIGAFTLFLSGFVDARLDPPVSVSWLFLGGVTLAYWWGPLRRRRVHYAAFGGVFVLLGLSPLVTGTLSGPPLDYVTYTVIMGLGAIVCGILDHVMLVRTLRPLPPDADA